MHLVRPKDPVDPRKQDGVVYKISCEWDKVYIGEIGKCMHELIKEDDRNTRLSQTQTSADSEHANKTRVIRSGTKLGLLTETITGTLVDLRRLST